MNQRHFVSVASLAFAFATGCAAETAESAGTEQTAESELSSSAPVYEYKTEGGFTRFDLDVQVFKTGRVTVAEKLHDGATVAYESSISAKELASLKASVPANFASLPSKVYRAHMVADIPKITVSYRGKHVTLLPQAGTPVADAAFSKYVESVGGVQTIVGDKELVRFESSGGFAFQQTTLTIKNGGECHLTEKGVKTKDVDCYVDLAALAELHQDLAAKDAHGAYVFYGFPRKFTGPTTADGIAYSVTWDGPEGPKTVASATAAHEAKAFTEIREVLSKIVTSVEQQQL